LAYIKGNGIFTSVSCAVLTRHLRSIAQLGFIYRFTLQLYFRFLRIKCFRDLLNIPLGDTLINRFYVCSNYIKNIKMKQCKECGQKLSKAVSSSSLNRYGVPLCNEHQDWTEYKTGQRTGASITIKQEVIPTQVDKIDDIDTAMPEAKAVY
jgi:hypothetical protein